MERTGQSEIERREFLRRSRSAVFEVRVGSYREILETRNVSSGGMFLETKGKAPLPVRTIVCLTEEGKETVLGRVIWVSEDGMGVEFIERPADCCKTPKSPDA